MYTAIEVMRGPRKSNPIHKLIALDVFIDNHKIDSIEAGSMVGLKILPGKHSLLLRGPFAQTNTIEFSIEEQEIKRFGCDIAKRHYLLLTAMSLIILGGCYLWQSPIGPWIVLSAIGTSLILLHQGGWIYQLWEVQPRTNWPV